jgi:predicted metal-binding membrane protein
VGGLVPGAALDRSLETALRHDRRVVAASLALVVLLAWLYLWHDAAMMRAMPDMARPTLAGAFAMSFVMWTVMMIGMMLPSAAPAILLYGAMVRRHGEQGRVLPAAWIFCAGYLVVWTSFSAAAASLQIVLERAALLTPGLASANTVLSASVLAIAGAYQWLPLKDVCLRKCRDPLTFFLTRWRGGPAGAFAMGAQHGLYCVGCCWALMGVLFVAGVMNLLWVGLIAGFVLVEKLLPGSRMTSRIAGGTLVVASIALLAA